MDKPETKAELIKSRELWRDRYWKAQAQIDRLYELKFKEQWKHKKDSKDS